MEGEWGKRKVGHKTERRIPPEFFTIVMKYNRISDIGSEESKINEQGNLMRNFRTGESGRIRFSCIQYCSSAKYFLYLPVVLVAG